MRLTWIRPRYIVALVTYRRLHALMRFELQPSCPWLAASPPWAMPHNQQDHVPQPHYAVEHPSEIMSVLQSSRGSERRRFGAVVMPSGVQLKKMLRMSPPPQICPFFRSRIEDRGWRRWRQKRQRRGRTPNVKTPRGCLGGEDEGLCGERCLPEANAAVRERASTRG